MADGSVVIGVKMNTSQADKDLAKLKKDIETVESTIGEQEAKKSPLVAQAKKLRQEIQLARAEVDKYRQAWISGVVGADTQQARAQERLNQIESEYNGIAAQINKINDKLGPAYEKLDRMKEEAGGLQQNVDKAAKNTRKMEKATEKADKKMGLFAKRFRGIVLSAFVFNILSAGFRKLTEWMGNVIKSNDKARSAIAKLKGALLTLAQPLVDIVVPAFISLVNVLTRIVSTLAKVFATLTGSTIDASKKSAAALKEQTDALDGVSSSADKATGSLAGFDEINKLSSESSESSLSTIAPDFNFGVGGELKDLKNFLAILGGAIALLTGNWIPLLISALAALSVHIADTFGEGENVTSGLKSWFQGFIDFFAGIFTGDFDRAVKGIGGIFDGLRVTFYAVIDSIRNMIGVFFDWLDEKTNGKFTGILNFLKEVLRGLIKFISGAFTKDWSRAWEGAGDIFKGILNSIVGRLESAINVIIRGINWLISQLNKIKFSVPDWVPGVGGKSIGININAIRELSIPRLATGAVIPPNREFLAVLGDQKQGTNIEAPLETIKQAFREAMQESGGGGAFTCIVNLDGKEVARNTVKHVNDMTRSAGKPVLLV